MLVILTQCTAACQMTGQANLAEVRNCGLKQSLPNQLSGEPGLGGIIVYCPNCLLAEPLSVSEVEIYIRSVLPVRFMSPSDLKPCHLGPTVQVGGTCPVILRGCKQRLRKVMFAET